MDDGTKWFILFATLSGLGILLVAGTYLVRYLYYGF